MVTFQPVDKQLFFSKHDPQDLRLGDLVLAAANTKTKAVIVGYADDEGVQLSGGRLGACQGPTEIRRSLYRLTAHALDKTVLQDGGDLIPQSNQTLDERHQAAQNFAKKCFSEGTRLISLGGGHDYGFPDCAAFLESFKGSKEKAPVILNFDAHLDVRKSTLGNSSGTPFRRLFENVKSTPFHFVEVGVQRSLNSQSDWEWAKAKGAMILSLEEMMVSAENQASFILQKISPWLEKRHPFFLSFDMDGFEAPVSAGTSAPSVIGLQLPECLKIMQTICANADVQGLGIYEVAPKYDPSGFTTKAASQLIWQYLTTLE